MEEGGIHAVGEGEGVEGEGGGEGERFVCWCWDAVTRESGGEGRGRLWVSSARNFGAEGKPNSLSI